MLGEMSAADAPEAGLDGMPDHKAFLWRIRAEIIFAFVEASAKDLITSVGPEMEQLLRTHYIEGLGMNECAEKMGLRSTVAKTRIIKCTQMLREVFREDSVL